MIQVLFGALAEGIPYILATGEGVEKISSEAVQEDEGEEMDEEDDDRVGKPRTRGTVGCVQNFQTGGCCDPGTALGEKEASFFSGACQQTKAKSNLTVF